MKKNACKKKLKSNASKRTVKLWEERLLTGTLQQHHSQLLKPDAFFCTSPSSTFASQPLIQPCLTPTTDFHIVSSNSSLQVVDISGACRVYKS